MTGFSVIDALKRKFRVSTDAALAGHLGISIPAVQLWKNRSRVTARQVASLTHKASFQSNFIRPIVEFFPILRSETKRGASFEVFSAKVPDEDDHPYRCGLKTALSVYHGIYIFYDSRGQVIYAGKARRQNLWKEINLAFNRDRGEVQSIKRVRHPSRRVQWSNAERQITSLDVALHELASYFSAYHVPDKMIDDLEAMLVRGFANDVLNVRMEKFE